MRRKVDNLKLQCKELAEHRRIYHVRQPRLFCSSMKRSLA